MPAGEEAEGPSWVDWVSKASDWRVPVLCVFVCVCCQGTFVLISQEGSWRWPSFACPWFWSREVSAGWVAAAAVGEVRVGGHLGSRFFFGTKDR